MQRRVMQLELLLGPPSQTPSLDGAVRRAVLPGGPLWYRLVRSSRRSIAIVIQRSRVDVRAPRWTPVAEIEAFLHEKERWVRRRIEEERREPLPFMWREGERLPVLGEPLQLSMAGAPTGVRRLESALEVGLPATAGPMQLRSSVLAWLRAEARRVFVERIGHFVPRLCVPMPDMKLSNARTQWGSCNARGRVLLNWRLVHMPLDLIDYVVAHELSHLRELNHSPRFWDLVGSVYPAFTAARRELERLGRELPEL